MSCKYCGGSGKIKKPRDEEYYEQLVDKYYDSGQFNMDTSIQMALKQIGYDVVPCPYCEHK